MTQIKTYETERLILRPVTEEDAEFIYRLLNSPKWIQFIGDRNINSIKEAEQYIQNRMIPQYKRLGFGNYIAIRKSDNVKIGTCGIYDREGLEGIDIGFAFLPDYEKKGYALESCEKVKDIAFNEFNIKQLSGITAKGNIASQRLLEKLGLHFIQLMRLPNEDEDVMLYQLKQ